LYQPRQASNQGGQQVPPDRTLYQPRQASNQSRPQGRTDDTIYQPRVSGQLATKIPPNLLRILGVVLAVGVALGLVTYIYTQLQSGKEPSKQQGLPNSGRIQN
jgi:serine/threonine-protein kinase